MARPPFKESMATDDKNNVSDANQPAAPAIRAIDPRSVHRITSGQVVVDLQSAVKELVENSLDAGSTTIDVKFRDYGLESLEVSDNGTGIREDDLAIAGLKHYTSKLSSFEGLEEVKTFGFRGEALSSLCGLAKVKLVTATAETEPRGWALEFDKMGRVASKKRCSRLRGTTVTVDSLFHNLPVRRKQFTKEHKKHFNHAQVTLQAYGLISLNLNLNVSNQPQKGPKSFQFQTKSNDHVQQNFSNVFTPKASQLMMELDLTLHVKADHTVLRSIGTNSGLRDAPTEVSTAVAVKGLISRPVHGQGRNSADRQFYYINGRPFSPNKISKCFNEVYKQFNTHQHPVVMANFILPEDAYDVNVDPNKRTIFLHSEGNLIESLRVSLLRVFQPFQSTFTMAQLDSSQSTYATQTPNLSLVHPTLPKRKFESSSEGRESFPPPLSGKSPVHQSMEPDIRSVEKPISIESDIVSLGKDKLPRPEDDCDDSPGWKKIRLTSPAKSLSGDHDIDIPPTSASVNARSPVLNPPDVTFPGAHDTDMPLVSASDKVSALLSRSPEASPFPGSKKRTDEVNEESTSITVESHDPARGKSRGSPGSDIAEMLPILPTPPPPPSEDNVWIPSRMRGERLSASSSFLGSSHEASAHQMTLDTSGASWSLKATRETAEAKHTSRNLHAPRNKGKTKKAVCSSDKLKHSLSRFIHTGGRSSSQRVVTEEDNNEVEAEEDEGGEEEQGDESECEVVEDSFRDEQFVTAGFDSGQESMNDDSLDKRQEKGSPQLVCPLSAIEAMPSDVEEHSPNMASVPSNKAHVDLGSKPRRDERVEARLPEIIPDREPRTTMVEVDMDSIQQHWDERRVVGKRRLDIQISQVTRAIPRSLDSELVDLKGGAGVDQKDESQAERVLSLRVFKDEFRDRMKVIGQFNLGFIIVKRIKDEKHGGKEDGEDGDEDLFIVDQHASDEKFNFEKLQRLTKLTGQRLLTPKLLNLTASQELTAMENLDILEFNGFGVHVDENERVGNRVKLVAQPVWGGHSWDSTDLEELLHLIESRGSTKEVVRPSKTRKFMASRACRMSCMIGDALNCSQMDRIIKQMGTMDQPWACPHGRPTMRWLAKCGFEKPSAAAPGGGGGGGGGGGRGGASQTNAPYPTGQPVLCKDGGDMRNCVSIEVLKKVIESCV